MCKFFRLPSKYTCVRAQILVSLKIWHLFYSRKLPDDMILIVRFILHNVICRRKKKTNRAYFWAGKCVKSVATFYKCVP